MKRSIPSAPSHPPRGRTSGTRATPRRARTRRGSRPRPCPSRSPLPRAPTRSPRPRAGPPPAGTPRAGRPWWGSSTGASACGSRPRSRSGPGSRPSSPPAERPDRLLDQRVPADLAARARHRQVGGLPLRRSGGSPSQVRSQPGRRGRRGLASRPCGPPRGLHHDVRSSSNSSPTPCCIRRESCWCSPRAGGSAARTERGSAAGPSSATRPPFGIAAYAPTIAIGTTGIFMSSASRDVPWRNPLPPVGRTRPLGEHDDVPPVPDELLGLGGRLLPAPRSTGNPAYTTP